MAHIIVPPTLRPRRIAAARCLIAGVLYLTAPAGGDPVDDSAAVRRPEVWVCAGERIADLLRPDAEWPVVRRHLSGIKLYVDRINQAAPTSPGP